MSTLLMTKVLLLMVAAPGQAADPTKPHPHRGLVPPFPASPPAVMLEPAQLRDLERGRSVLVQTEGRSGGRGAAIQDIEAPVEGVWDRILDFADYPRMVDPLLESSIYRESEDEIFVRMVLKVMTLRYEYYIHHVVHPLEEGRGRYLTWTLDYDRESDLDDSVGYWYATPHPDKPGWTRLYYSVDMRTRGWMPDFVRNMIAAKGLRDATSWVKREAEAARAR